MKEEPFKTEGKVMVNAGWMEVYGKEAQTDDQRPTLAPVQPNETVKTEKIECQATQTKPPRALLRSHAALGAWKARANWSRTRNCAKR